MATASKATLVMVSALAIGSQVKFHKNVKVKSLAGNTFRVVRAVPKGVKKGTAFLRNILNGQCVTVSGKRRAKLA